MSKFIEKVRQGIIPTDKDWTEYLVIAHEKAPSMTPHAYADYKTKEGLSSYELLAQTCKLYQNKNITAVDLACGDGYLISFVLPLLNKPSKIIGVDMSNAELAIARNRLKEPNISFINAHAQKIPLDDHSVDVILCHMAFMLMLPLEPVVQEISRILKPGGSFSAVIGGVPTDDPFYLQVRRLYSEFLASRFPNMKDTKTGDSRVASEDGLKQLFTLDLGFNERIETLNFELQYIVEPAGIWSLMKDMYFVGMLPDIEQDNLRKAFIDLGDKNKAKDGKVTFGYPMRKFTITKQS